MKYVKMLGLLAVAAAALMAFAGTASATVTSPTGVAYGGVIEATSTNTVLDGTVTISCKHSLVKGTPNSTGNTTGTVETLHFSECSRSVTVTANGDINIASDGTVTSTGARVTVQTTILGFPVHCIYATNNTKVGTLTDSHDTGGSTAVIHIGSSPIPQEQTSGACGNDAVWTGSYTITNPDKIYVD